MPDEWQLPVTRQLGALDQLVQQCLREAVVLVREVAPVEQHRHAGDFPVARRRVFTGRELAGVSVSADDVGVAVQPLRKLPVDSSAALPRPRRLRLGSVSGPRRPTLASPRAQTSAMWPGCRNPVAKTFGVFAGADAEGVQYHNKCAFHLCSPACSHAIATAKLQSPLFSKFIPNGFQVVARRLARVSP